MPARAARSRGTSASTCWLTGEPHCDVCGAEVGKLLSPALLPLPPCRDDPCAFTLVEEYADAAAAAAHKATPHYLRWRDAVAGLMAEPRAAASFTRCE